MDRGQLIETMQEILGPEGVIHEHEELRTYECDGLMNYRVIPDLVVLPEIGEQVQQIVKPCYDEGIPFVARGSGTGLSGGALPVESGVLIVLTRMRRILEVDIPNGRIVVEPGVINVWVSPGGRRRGLLLRPRPGEPDRLLHRRQPRRELGRRPLPEVRLYHQPRHGRRGRLARRLGGPHRRRKIAGRPRLRAARRLRRLGGDSRHRDQDNAQDLAPARGRADACSRLRGYGGGRWGGLGDHRRRHHARRHRDDGRAHHRGGREAGLARLPRGRRDPDRRARRTRGRGSEPVRAGHKGLRGERRLRDKGRRGRRGARPVLEGPQGRLRGDGPHLQRLLRPGRGRPAHGAGGDPEEDIGAERGVRPAGSPTSSTPATATCIR